MADQVMKFQLIIDGINQATEGLKTLKQKLKEIQDAKDRAFQSKNTTAFNQLAKAEEDTYRKLQEFESTLIKQKDAGYAKYLQQEQQIRNEIENTERARELAQTKAFESHMAQKQKELEAISEGKSKQNLDANKQYWTDEENSIKRRTELLKQQLQTRVSQEQILEKERIRQVTGNPALERQQLGIYNTIRKEQMQSSYNSLFNSKEYDDYSKRHGIIPNIPPSYKSQLSQLNQAAEQYWQTWKKTGDVQAKLNFDNAHRSIQLVNSQMNEFNSKLGVSQNSLYSITDRIRSHFSWIASGALLGALLAIPISAINTAKEVESLGTKLKQNLELSDQYKGNIQSLDIDVKSLINNATVLATGYGLKLNDVMQGMVTISRRFKDVDTITYITNLAATMAKMDFVPMEKAAGDLEAVILQFGLNAVQTKDFVNQFTWAVHNARITGTELLEGLQRSGSSFKQFNMGTAEAIALISTITTVTARSGEIVGNTFKSLLTNIEGGYAKAQKVFEAMGIQVYQLDENGAQQLRSGEAIMTDILSKYKQLDDASKNMLANAVSGGKFQINQTKALLDEGSQVYQNFITGIRTANDQLTTKLLATGLDNFQTKLDQVSASWESFSVIVGQQVLPILSNVLQGLASGVIWLTQNKAAVDTFVSALKIATEVLMVYLGKQLLSNTALGVFASNIKLGIGLAPAWNAAMASMGTAARGLGVAVAVAAAELIPLVIAAMTLKATYDSWQQHKSEENHIARLQQYRDNTGAFDYGSADEVENLMSERDNIPIDNGSSYGGFKGTTEAKHRNQINNKIREDLTKEESQLNAEAIAKQAQALGVKAYNDMIAKGLGYGGTKNPPGGIDIPDPSKTSNGSTPNTTTTGTEYQVAHDQLKAMLNTYNAFAQLLETRYATALDMIKEKEDIEGQSLDTLNQKLLLNSDQWDLVAQEKIKVADQMEVLSDQMNEQDFQTVSGVSLAKYRAMSKEQRGALLENIRDTKQENALLLSQIEAYNRLSVVSEEYTKKMQKYHHENEVSRQKTIPDFINNQSDLDRKVGQSYQSLAYGVAPTEEEQHKMRMQQLQDEWDKSVDIVNTTHEEKVLKEQIIVENNNQLQQEKEKYEWALKQQEINIRNAEYQYNLSVAKMGNHPEYVENVLKEQQLKIKELKEKIKDVWNKKDEIENTVPNYQQKQEWQDLNLQLQQLQNELDKTKDKMYPVREAGANLFNEMIVQGNSFKNWWNNQWKQLATEAINRMFSIKSAASTLSTIFGSIFGIGGGQEAPAHNAQGSIGNQEQLTWVREGNKKEAIIPLEDNKDRGQSLVIQAAKELGMLGGTEIVPALKNPELAKSPIVNVQVQQNDAHIAAIERQNELMVQQNAMIADMAKNNNGGIVVMPVAPSADQVLSVLQKNPQALWNILGQQQSRGFR